ncbi:response regulator [Planctomycetota bacterium]
MQSGADQTRRVLVIDDNPDIYKDFQLILDRKTEASGVDDLQAKIFGDAADPGETKDSSAARYQLDYAGQGKEGVQRIQEARANNDPYRLVFVDMRMPPGWDGLTTIQNIWEIDPDVQVVICTAYSDHSWHDIHKQLGESDSWLLLKKPFDQAEVQQLASALTCKWELAYQAGMKLTQLEQMVEEQTQVIAAAQKTAERAEQAKSDFFRGMCERIRPNTETILDLCEHITEESLTDIQSQCLNRITSTSKNLLSIIDDLLDVSQLDVSNLPADA